MFSASYFSASYFAVSYGLSLATTPSTPYVPTPARTLLVPRGDRRLIVVAPEA